jgi:flavin-binding protein dodecin
MAVAKVIALTAASKKGLDDAIEHGMAKATDTLENVEGAWIQDIKVTAKNGKISEWRVNMKVTFVLN